MLSARVPQPKKCGRCVAMISFEERAEHLLDSAVEEASLRVNALKAHHARALHNSRLGFVFAEALAEAAKQGLADLLKSFDRAPHAERHAVRRDNMAVVERWIEDFLVRTEDLGCAPLEYPGGVSRNANLEQGRTALSKQLRQEAQQHFAGWNNPPLAKRSLKERHPTAYDVCLSLFSGAVGAVLGAVATKLAGG